MLLYIYIYIVYKNIVRQTYTLSLKETEVYLYEKMIVCILQQNSDNPNQIQVKCFYFNALFSYIMQLFIAISICLRLDIALKSQNHTLTEGINCTLATLMSLFPVKDIRPIL